MRSGGLLAAPGVDALELANIIFGRALSIECKDTTIAQSV